MAGYSHEQQRRCTLPAHLNALKLDDGTYWTINPEDERARELITDRENRGIRMRVEGVLYERIHTLEVESWQPIGPQTAQLVFR